MAELNFDAPTIALSLPTQIEMHMIQNWELTTLKEGGKDRSFEIALATGGAAAGFFQNALSVARSVYSKEMVAMSDLLLATVFVVFVTCSVVLLLKSRGLSSKIDEIVEEIKARPIQKGSSQKAKLGSSETSPIGVP